MKPCTIKVTQKHIDYGARCTPWQCPIALAFNEVGYDVSVVPNLHIRPRNKDISYEIPDVASRWAYAFDSGKEVKPFSFEFTAKKIVLR